MNSISLFNVLDGFVDSCSTDNYTVTTTGGNTSIGYYYTTYPQRDWTDININLFDWSKWEIPKVETPKYPVSNYYIQKDGTSVIEIACSGFSKDELKIERIGDKLTVIGEKYSTEKENEKKYSYRNIAQRDFKLSYKCSDKMDLDNIDISLDLGILKIVIPMKENEKPKIEQLKIK